MSALVQSLQSLPVAMVVVLGAAAVLFLVLMRASRLPRAPWYAGRGLTEMVLVPALVGLLGAAIVLLTKLGHRLFTGALPEAGEAVAAAVLAVAFGAVIVIAARALPRGGRVPAVAL